MEETDVDSLLPDPVTCDADKEKYNDFAKILKYIKVVKREFKKL